MIPSSGNDFFRAATTFGISPCGLVASRPSGVFSAGSIEGNSASAGTPSFRQRSATGSNRSKVKRLTPGMDATGCDLALSIDHKHGVDEIVRGQVVLPHHPSRKVVAAQPAHPPARVFP